VSTLVDRAVPARLGSDARRFLGATWLVQVSDGLALVAGPLAVASLTASPFLVALAVALHRLPVLLGGPYAAFLADLVNRRLLLVAADGARCAVLVLLALLLALGVAPVGLVLAAMLLLGALETVADSARGPVLSMLAGDAATHDALGARVDGGFVVGTQLLGPILGGLLFGLGSGAPFVVQALVLGVAVAVLGRIHLAGPARGPAPAAAARPVRSGLRRIAVDPALSGLVLSGVAAQAAWAASWCLLVVYTARHLGLGPAAFGLLVAAGAIGGIVGILTRPVVDRVVRLTNGLRTPHVVLGGLALEAAGHVTLALVHQPWIAAAVIGAMGTVGFVAGDVARDLRRARTAGDGTTDVVSAAVATLGLAATVAGCLAGGLAATLGGVPAAYLGGAVLLAVALAVLGRRVASAATLPASGDAAL
jgi:MFS family permease